MRGNTLFVQKNVDKTQRSDIAEITFYPITSITGVAGVNYCTNLAKQWDSLDFNFEIKGIHLDKIQQTAIFNLSSLYTDSAPIWFPLQIKRKEVQERLGCGESEKL